jgi:excisionase family DNA binding protein
MIAGNDIRLRNEEAPMGNLDTRDRTEPELISIREAARMVGVSNRTMNRLCLEGKVKAVRIGCQWRINRKALRESAGLQ